MSLYKIFHDLFVSGWIFFSFSWTITQNCIYYHSNVSILDDTRWGTTRNVPLLFILLTIKIVHFLFHFEFF